MGYSIRRVVIFLIILGKFGSFQAQLVDPEVIVGNTRIIGHYGVARNGRSYSSFRGIQYAEIPQRFQESIPIKEMGPVIMAQEFGNSCPQVEIVNKTFIGDEDCLFLNVYSPKRGDLLPVMVWFLPGGFEWGTSDSYDPKYFMDEDVILVTFNYRLGALGFLSTGDSLVPGNMGLKDQLLVLKWIQKNIVSFGGDPHKVTLFGNSAGGASVHFHILSSASRGLFHNAIAQSGTANAVWATQANPEFEAKALGEFVRCPTADMSQMIKCIRSKPAEDIVLAVQNFRRWSIFPLATFSAVIEPEDTPNAILTVSPHLLLRIGVFNRVPLIAGCIPNEGIPFSTPILESPNLVRDLSDRWNIIAPHFLDFREFLNDKRVLFRLNEISEKIQSFYFDTDSRIQESKFQNITNAISDRYILFAMDNAMRYHARSAPVYPYVFTYDGGDRTLTRTMMEISTDYGLGHFDEIQFLFNGIYGAPEYLKQTNDDGTLNSQYEVSRTLIKLWTNFAKYSVPVIPSERGFVWKKIPKNITKHDIDYLEISSTIQPSSELNLRQRLQFWDNLLESF